MRSFLRTWFASCMFIAALGLVLLSIYNGFNLGSLSGILAAATCVWAGVQMLKRDGE